MGARIGVLALQGAFAAHARTLAELGATTHEVRTPADLGLVDALVMPGGESTTMSMLLESSGLFDPIAERIADPEKTHEIKDVINDGAFYGMVSFDQWLLKLLQDGQISTESAFKAVSNKHDFELAMQQAGLALPV